MFDDIASAYALAVALRNGLSPAQRQAVAKILSLTAPDSRPVESINLELLHSTPGSAPTEDSVGADGLLTTSVAAAYLKVATSTLAKMRVAGTGPPYCKLGRRVVYRRSDLVCRDHPERARIDVVLGRLVSLGVSEAHEVETRIEAEQASIGASR